MLIEIPKLEEIVPLSIVSVDFHHLEVIERQNAGDLFEHYHLYRIRFLVHPGS